MYFTVTSNGHSYETTYELGVPEIYRLSTVDPITIPTIKCELKQTTSVIDANKGTKHRLIQSKFSANQNPQLAFYELNDPNKQIPNDKYIASFIVEPKIRCINTVLVNQYQNQFEIAPSELTMKYFATDIKGKKILMAQEKKMINNDYILLKWGTETGSKPKGCDWNVHERACEATESFKVFNIHIVEAIQNKLPNGNYKSTHTFELEGEIKINWVGYRDQVYTLPVYAQDIKTSTVFQVVKGSGYQPPTLDEKIAECKAKNGFYKQTSDDKAQCIVCQVNYLVSGNKCLPPPDKKIDCPNNTEWDESVKDCRVSSPDPQKCPEGEIWIGVIGDLGYCISDGWHERHQDPPCPEGQDWKYGECSPPEVEQLEPKPEPEPQKCPEGQERKEGICSPPEPDPPKPDPPEPKTPEPETPESWLEKNIAEIQDCLERSESSGIAGVAFCVIQIEAFYLTGVGVLAIGIISIITKPSRRGGYYV